MISDPDVLLAGYMKRSTDQIIVHAEACPHLHRTVTRIKEAGHEVGVAINPGTPVSAVEEVLQHLDLVLPMSVNPGFGGQTFIPETLDKVRRLRQMVRERGYSTQIEVDGGIKADWTAEESVKAGATILVAGTAIFNDKEPVSQCMAGMRSCVQGLRERY
jgi:ribulose-phosphate 3-epimerase